MKYVHNDGGRAGAGFKGDTGDCAARAISIAAQIDYREAYDLLNQQAKRERRSKGKKGLSNARTGVHKVTMQRAMEALGWQWVPTMKIGQGCTVHMRSEELPSGRIIVSLSRHYAAVIDGELHDTYDSSRDGSRCVYGYWKEA